MNGIFHRQGSTQIRHECSIEMFDMLAFSALSNVICQSSPVVRGNRVGRDSEVCVGACTETGRARGCSGRKQCVHCQHQGWGVSSHALPEGHPSVRGERETPRQLRSHPPDPTIWFCFHLYRWRSISSPLWTEATIQYYIHLLSLNQRIHVKQLEVYYCSFLTW